MFSQPLVGHERPLEWLRNALGRGRLGHAFLFVGPEGIGKRRAALHVAQGLLCEARPPEELDPCGRCAACVQVDSGAHPDFFGVAKPDDKNVVPIETIQDLCRQLTLKPARGKLKIALVDDADRLNDESANCFLKTLEEPPERSLLILLASSPETQLKTIVSRSQIVRFTPLSNEQVAGLLLAQGVAQDQESADRYASWSAGSVGWAAEFAKPEWLELRPRLLEGLAALPNRSVELAEALGRFVDEAGKDAASKRFRSLQLVRLAADFYRDCLTQEREFGSAARAMDPLVAKTAAKLSTQQLLDLIERCLDADYHIRRFLSQSVSMECWIDDLAQITAGQYVESIG